MPWEMSIAQDASERLRARPFRTKAVPLTVIPAPTVWIAHVLLGLCIVIPRVGPLMYLRFHPSAWSAQPTSHGMKTSVVRMPFPPPELLVLPSTPPPPILGADEG
jgi:hypothetical protein